MENTQVNNYVHGVQDKIEDNTEKVKELDEDIIDMQKDFFGSKYEEHLKNKQQ